MNQILTFHNIGNSKESMKNAISFLSLFIIVLGIVFITEGLLGYNNLKNRKIDIDTPAIEVERNNGITRLYINSSIGIQKIIYYWNDNLKNTIDQNGEKEVNLDIDTALGINSLNIQIIDSDGNEITYNPIKIAYEENDNSGGTPSNSNGIINGEEIDIEKAIASDKTKPKINLSASTGKVVINVVDNVKMSFVTYSWNDEEPITITGLSEDEKSINTEIDVRKGDNTLRIKAYDKAGNIEELDKEVHGTDGPNIDVRKENGQIVVNITDEFKITKIKYNFNGEEKTIDNINKVEYELKLDLVDGTNYIILEAYENNVKSEYKGKTTK